MATRRRIWKQRNILINVFDMLYVAMLIIFNI